jgi:fatty acid desaturase
MARTLSKNPPWDLESVNKGNLFNREGTSYLEFRRSLSVNYFRVWGEITLGWCAVVLIPSVLIALPELPLGWSVGVRMLASVLVGLSISFLHLYFHEAAHFHLASEKRRSDQIANALLAPLLLTCIEFYRAVHMAHHRLLATGKDTENSYFSPLTLGFLIKTVIGKRLFEVFFSRAVSEAFRVPDAVSRKNRLFFFLGSGFHLSVCLGLYVFGGLADALAWAIGVGCFVPFFGAVRQLLEHRGPGLGNQALASEPGPRYTATFKAGPWAALFGAAGFNRHAIHHWDPSLSYTCFEKVEQFLLSTPVREPYLEARTTYFAAFCDRYLDAGRSTDENHTLFKLPKRSANVLGESR